MISLKDITSPANLANEECGLYEFDAIARSHDLINQALVESKTDRSLLARKLARTPSYITQVLRDGQNMTIKNFARIAYHLGFEVVFSLRRIER